MRSLNVSGRLAGASRVRFDLTLDRASRSPDYTYLDYFEVTDVQRGQAISSPYALTAQPGSLAPFAPFAFVFVRESEQGGVIGDSETFAIDAPSTVYISNPDDLLRPVRTSAYSRAPIAEPVGGADYVVVTRPALRASAEAYASYRRTSGYRVLVVDQQDLFDQFDGGRQRPIAIRRFLYATQDWTTPPRYVLFWGDALLPFKGKTLEPWEVISFGNSVSDSWYGMQFNGPTDWYEIAAIGRIPVRSNAEGDQFLTKMQRYESVAACSVA